MRTRGISFMILSSVFYGLYGVWAKLMGDSFDPFSQAALRSLLIISVLGLILAAKKQSLLPNFKRDWKLLLLFLLAGLLIAGPSYYSVNAIGVGLSTLIFYVSLLLTMFIFDIVRDKKERTFINAVAIGLAIGGMILVTNFYSTQLNWLGIVAAVVSGFGVGVDLIVSKYLKASTIHIALWTWSAAAISNVIIVLLIGATVPATSSYGLWSIVVLFAATSLFSSYFSISGVKLINAGLAGLLGLLEIVFAIIFGIVLFDEPLTRVILLGSVCIIIAAAIPDAHLLWTKRQLKLEQS